MPGRPGAPGKGTVQCVRLEAIINFLLMAIQSQ
jgi:hypothetical protein